MKRKKLFQKSIAGALCFALLLSLTACGGKDTSPAAGPSADIQASGEKTPGSGAADTSDPSALPASSEPLAEPEQPAVKATYTDFYKEVNQDWFAENPLKENVPYVAFDEDGRELVISRVTEMFEAASPDDFAQDDPMRKMVLFYQQMQEEGVEKEASMTRLKQITDTIESQKNIDQFCKNILMDPDFACFNALMNVNYMPCMDYRYRVHYYLRPLCSYYFDKTEEEKLILENCFCNMLTELGYAPETARSMAQNAVKLDGIIWETMCAEYSGLYLYEEGSEELEGCTFPFLDIQKALGYDLYVTSDHAEYCFFATDIYYEFIQELFVPENLQMIKDYYVVSALECLCPAASMNFNLLYADIMFQFMGIDEHDYEDPELSLLNATAILSVDDGVVNKWYADKYVTEAQKAEVRAMIDDVSAEMQEIVEAIPWTSPKSRRAVKMKIANLRYFLGCYDEYNQLTDMEIGETGIDTLLSLLRNQREYNQVFLKEGGLHDDTSSTDLSAVNAHYLEDSAGIAICNGLLAKMELQDQAASYEERLAIIGEIIAHEVAHAIDDNNFHLDRHIIRAEWFDDAHSEGLYNTITPIYELCSKMKTENGNAINAGATYNETYCDLVAMKCCLQLLAKRENADYDAFFRTYARQDACLMTPAYEKLRLRNDSHLPDRERINYALAQFDEFYETYDIPEDSPYFIPKAKRIVLFQ